MNKLLFVLVFTFVSSSGLIAQYPEINPKWKLVWEDGFDKLNEEIWYIPNNFDHYGAERQVYTFRPQNVAVKEGKLVLTALKEDYACPKGQLAEWGCARQFKTGKNYEYTSGWVETKEAYNTQYGYIESRIKLPYDQSFWTAFWTYVGEGKFKYVNSGEIDIFEMLGFLPSTKMTSNIHRAYCPEGQTCPDIPDYYQELEIPDYVQDYHMYAIEWSPERISWFVDNREVRTLYQHGIVDPVRLIFNFAIFENYEPSAQSFPAEMCIDYVKVYHQVKISNAMLTGNESKKPEYNYFMLHAFDLNRKLKSVPFPLKFDLY